ncbi:MAG: L-histidine N(alpha)-methyltransferase [Acidimicrobiia bacterium]
MSRIRVDVHVRPEDRDAALRADVLEGLGATPKELPPKWFYDDRGSQLFDEITRLDEYYPTRTERAILEADAGAIVAAAGCDTLVELGSGTSDKTRLLLDAMAQAGSLARFVPFDVSEHTLRDAAAAVAVEYPGVQVHAIAGDFDRHLGEIPGAGGGRTIAFLGGTIGNFAPAQRKAFFAEVADMLAPGETFLLGTDLVKDVARLEAAYDDASGVTAEFNLNVLRVVNRELGADFDLDAFAHVARYDTDADWIEMLLEATRPMTVTVPSLGLEVGFAAGERMRTEISAKFRRDGLAAELAATGLTPAGWWTDPAADFALSLWRRT